MAAAFKSVREPEVNTILTQWNIGTMEACLRQPNLVPGHYTVVSTLTTELAVHKIHYSWRCRVGQRSHSVLCNPQSFNRCYQASLPAIPENCRGSARGTILIFSRHNTVCPISPRCTLVQERVATVQGQLNPTAVCLHEQQGLHIYPGHYRANCSLQQWVHRTRYLGPFIALGIVLRTVTGLASFTCFCSRRRLPRLLLWSSAPPCLRLAPGSLVFPRPHSSLLLFGDLVLSTITSITVPCSQVSGGVQGIRTAATRHRSPVEGNMPTPLQGGRGTYPESCSQCQLLEHLFLVGTKILDSVRLR